MSQEPHRPQSPDALRRDRHFVLEAPDGDALLKQMRHAFQDDLPDTKDSLIVADVHMPRRGGLDLIQGLRELDDGDGIEQPNRTSWSSA
jgi:CheY-like chemotaxis protein